MRLHTCHDGLAPPAQSLNERASVKEPRHKSTIRPHGTRKHMTRVVRRLGGLELDITLRGVSWQVNNGGRGVLVLRDEGEPVDDGRDALLVVVHHQVGHAVGSHDLGATELVLRGVHLSALDEEREGGREGGEGECVQV